MTFRLVSFSQKRVQNVCRKWWQLKCGNSSGSRRSAFASSYFFTSHALIIRSIARLTQCGDNTVFYLDLNIKLEYPSTTLSLNPLSSFSLYSSVRAAFTSESIGIILTPDFVFGVVIAKCDASSVYFL